MKSNLNLHQLKELQFSVYREAAGRFEWFLNYDVNPCEFIQLSLSSIYLYNAILFSFESFDSKTRVLLVVVAALPTCN